jgi:hypothetical protein
MNVAPSVRDRLKEFSWAAMSAGISLLAFLPAAAAGTWLSDQAGGGDVLRLGLAAGLWTLIAASLTFGLALVLLPQGHLPRRAVALLILAGAAASALAESGLIIWTVDHYVYPDPDYMGWSIFLPVGLTALTAGAAAALVTGGTARLIAIVVAAGSLAGLVFLAVDSAPGAADGMSDSGPALAAAFAVAAAYAALAIYVLARAER